MRNLLLTIILGSMTTLAATAAGLPPVYDDAALHGVYFADAKEGWAVGDQGVVWHTPDGGKNWERQVTGTHASLRSVHFLTPYCGWIVGRQTLPNSSDSVGVVLFTEDCGATWTERTQGELPGLNYVKFFSETNGIAAGDGTDLMPGGVFLTQDGGKSWKALGGSTRATTWLGGDFTAANSGIVGGAWSKLNTVRDGKLAPAELDSLQGRSVHAVNLTGTKAIAACSGGTVLLSDNGGTKWSVANLGLPSDVLESLDFRTVARHGDRIWIAGRPGSVILCSTDAGKTWALHKTGWSLPIRSLVAASADVLYAVGDLGLILKSTDAGASWKPLKCGAQNAAVLFAHADGRSVPMDAVARLSAGQGYITAGFAVTSADTGAPTSRSRDAFRLEAALRSAGGGAADSGWMFPVANHLNEGTGKELLNDWDKRGANAEERLVKQLVLAYRIWKPEVIVSDAISRSSTPAEQLVLAAARKAFKLADDPNAFPEQLQTLGLAVHSPKKLYAVGDDAGTECAVKADNTAFEKRLIDSPRSFAESCFALNGSNALAPKQRGFRLISHRMPGAETHTELMQGIHLAEGGTARRKLPIFGDGLELVLAEREKAVKTQLKLEALAVGSESGIAAERATIAIAANLKELPDDIACRTGVSIGRQLAASGRWIAAREIFLLIVSRYSGFPEAIHAVRWLTAYYSSAEARVWAEREQKVTVESSAVVQQAKYQELQIQKQSASATDPDAAKAGWKACLELESKLAGFGPAYSRDPAVLLATLSARRQLGLTGDAAKQMSAYFQTVPGAAELPAGVDLWRDCLAAEVWLFNPAAIPVQPKPVAICPMAPTKPFLDGKLDDDCWKAFTPLDMKSATGPAMKPFGTKTYFAHDDGFVYVGVECKHPEGLQVPKAEKRLRDDTVAGHDRVELLFDLDRDFQTYFRFQIDHRGCVAEDCWGEKSWNPKWHVAIDSTPTGWTAEIAIPREELAGSNFVNGTVWGMNVTRVVPGIGASSWSGPADAQPRPEGMGLIKFRGEAGK